MISANPSARLVLFTYKGISALTHACITREVSSWANLEHTIKAGEAAIDRARDFIVSEYLQDPDAPSVLLMVDDDVQWQEGDLSYIARKALELNAVVGGVYPKRQFGEPPPIRLGPEVRGEFTFGTDELLPATYVSTGFLAIPREVLQAVADTQPLLIDNTWPVFLPRVVEGPVGLERLSEDWAFCSRVAEAGFPVFAALKPRLTHLGEYQYRMIDAKTRPRPDEDVTITATDPAAPVEVSDGLRMYLDPTDGMICRALRNIGTWDADVADAIRTHLKPDWFFLDIGAHVGYHTLVAAGRCRRSMAIEPASTSFSLLEKNVALNKLNVELHQVAVSDRVGKTNLVFTPGSTGLTYTQAEATKNTVIVDTVPLGNLLNGEWPDFVKIDIEGDEVKVLRACPELLTHAKVIAAEYSDEQLRRGSDASAEDLKRLLTEAGFSVSVTSEYTKSGNFLAVKEIVLNNYQGFVSSAAFAATKETKCQD